MLKDYIIALRGTLWVRARNKTEAKRKANKKLRRLRNSFEWNSVAPPREA